MTLLAAVLVSALGGFIALCYEILWYRILGYVSGGPASTFGLLLGCYLSGLALGAWGVALDTRRGGSTSASSQLRGLAVLALAANIVGYGLIPSTAAMATAGVWWITLPLVALVAALLGVILPLTTHYAVPADKLAGSRLSLVYFGNIIGCAAGSFITGFVLMDVWPLARIALAVALLGLVFTGGLVAISRPRFAIGGLWTAALVTAAVCLSQYNHVLYDQLYEKLLYKTDHQSGLRFAQTVETRAGVVNVTADGHVFGGGVYDGMARSDLVDDRSDIIRVYALAAMHAGPREVLVIGLGSGAWAKIISAMPQVERVTVVEINPGYLTAISRLPTGSILNDPKVTVVIDDGRRWLLRHPTRRFDLIVSNTTFHWRAHATNLLSREFMEIVRAHLREGGVFYYNSTGSWDAVRTGLAVFHDGVRVMNFVAVSDSPIEFDADRWRSALLAMRIDEGPIFEMADERHRQRLDEVTTLARSLDRPAVPQGLERRESVLRRYAQAGVISDDNMLSEWATILPRVWLPRASTR